MARRGDQMGRGPSSRTVAGGEVRAKGGAVDNEGGYRIRGHPSAEAGDGRARRNGSAAEGDGGTEKAADRAAGGTGCAVLERACRQQKPKCSVNNYLLQMRGGEYGYKSKKRPAGWPAAQLVPTKTPPPRASTDPPSPLRTAAGRVKGVQRLAHQRACLTPCERTAHRTELLRNDTRSAVTREPSPACSASRQHSGTAQRALQNGSTHRLRQLMGLRGP
jgi:hypothetical protein